MSDTPQPDYDAQSFSYARHAMVDQQIAGRGVRAERVLEALREVPRHYFVPEGMIRRAYDDTPLQIGHGQTISQPYIVGLMTQLLQVQPENRVLEIGVGSGYQTAILSRLAAEVTGIERIPDLASQARERLLELDYDNVEIHAGDGTQGFAANAPYDRILIAAASPGIPPSLLEQLADRGRLVVPVGSLYEQVIEVAWRHGGSIHIERKMPVRFVPL